jgi:D-alanine-D-alanine ligase
MRLDHGVLVLHNTPRSFNVASTQAWAESDLSVMSQVAMVSAALDQLGLTHDAVGISRLGDVHPALAGRPEQVVFNLVEELVDCGPNIAGVPTLVGALGKACTGSGASCLSLCADKWQTKAALRARGAPTPPGFVVRRGQDGLVGHVPDGPLIVKPLCAHASEGIDSGSVVAGPGVELSAAVQRIHAQYEEAALVEQFIDGREVNVSLLQVGCDVRVLPLAEIDFSDLAPGLPRIVSYAAKWLPGTAEHRGTQRRIPAPLAPVLADRVRRLALLAWEATGCRGYARIDIRIDRRDRPFVLEVNPNPDISPDSGFNAALVAAGISDARFVQTVLANVVEEVEEII